MDEFLRQENEMWDECWWKIRHWSFDDLVVSIWSRPMLHHLGCSFDRWWSAVDLCRWMFDCECGRCVVAADRSLPNQHDRTSQMKKKKKKKRSADGEESLEKFFFVHWLEEVVCQDWWSMCGVCAVEDDEDRDVSVRWIDVCDGWTTTSREWWWWWSDLFHRSIDRSIDETWMVLSSSWTMVWCCCTICIRSRCSSISTCFAASCCDLVVMDCCSSWLWWSARMREDEWLVSITSSIVTVLVRCSMKTEDEGCALVLKAPIWLIGERDVLCQWNERKGVRMFYCDRERERVKSRRSKCVVSIEWDRSDGEWLITNMAWSLPSTKGS